LSKLAWYKQGGGVSDRQWNDILGVLAAKRGELDCVYLNEGAAELGVADLLSAALNERLGD